jgi:hypothetical protein
VFYLLALIRQKLFFERLGAEAKSKANQAQWQHNKDANYKEQHDHKQKGGSHN